MSNELTLQQVLDHFKNNAKANAQIVEVYLLSGRGDLGTEPLLELDLENPDSFPLQLLNQVANVFDYGEPGDKFWITDLHLAKVVAK